MSDLIIDGTGFDIGPITSDGRYFRVVANPADGVMFGASGPTMQITRNLTQFLWAWRIGDAVLAPNAAPLPQNVPLKIGV